MFYFNKCDSEVDKEKYPNAEQEYRFELYELESVKTRKDFKEKINKMKGVCKQYMKKC